MSVEVCQCFCGTIPFTSGAAFFGNIFLCSLVSVLLVFLSLFSFSLLLSLMGRGKKLSRVGFALFLSAKALPALDDFRAFSHLLFCHKLEEQGDL